MWWGGPTLPRDKTPAMERLAAAPWLLVLMMCCIEAGVRPHSSTCYYVCTLFIFSYHSCTILSFPWFSSLMPHPFPCLSVCLSVCLSLPSLSSPFLSHSLTHSLSLSLSLSHPRHTITPGGQTLSSYSTSVSLVLWGKKMFRVTFTNCF